MWDKIKAWFRHSVTILWARAVAFAGVVLAMGQSPRRAIGHSRRDDAPTNADILPHTYPRDERMVEYLTVTGFTDRKSLTRV